MRCRHEEWATEDPVALLCVLKYETNISPFGELFALRLDYVCITKTE